MTELRTKPTARLKTIVTATSVAAGAAVVAYATLAGLSGLDRAIDRAFAPKPRLPKEGGQDDESFVGADEGGCVPFSLFAAESVA